MFSLFESQSCCLANWQKETFSDTTTWRLASPSTSVVLVITARYRTRHCVSDRISCPHFECRHILLFWGGGVMTPCCKSCCLRSLRISFVQGQRPNVSRRTENPDRGFFSIFLCSSSKVTNCFTSFHVPPNS